MYVARFNVFSCLSDIHLVLAEHPDFPANVLTSSKDSEGARTILFTRRGWWLRLLREASCWRTYVEERKHICHHTKTIDKPP